MQNQTNTFKAVTHPLVKPNTLNVSPEGKVYDSRGIHNPSYLSSNGYMYEFIQTNDDRLILFPFDIIMASTFVAIPQDLIGKKLKVHHKNGRSSDCYYENLEWVEDIEEWKDVMYKDVKRGYYQVSNWGRVRSMLTDPPILMTPDSSSGYQRVWLASDSTRGLHCQIHRLVAWHFIQGYSETKSIVNHIDCCVDNCMWYNLEWVSIRENYMHSSMLGNQVVGCKGDISPVSKITENDAIEICYSLNKHSGRIIDTFNELKDSIPSLTYPIVSSIKYGDVFTYISDKILTNAGRKKQIRQTDPDVILDVSYCLKKNNGDVKKTKKELVSKYPWISYGWLWHLKDKSVGSEITDQVFTKDEFPKCVPLTENDAVIIINCLLKHNGDPYVNQTVFDELKDSIEGLTKDKVRSIKEKKAWKTLSDKYFQKGEI